MTIDDVYPRDERERYRIYRLDPDGGRTIVATCGSPEAIGVALVTLAGEGEFDGRPVGILDGVDERWLVNPWARP